VCIKKKEVLN